MPSRIREYGRANLSTVSGDHELLKGIAAGSQVWMSHGDTILKVPPQFHVITSTSSVEIAGFTIAGEKTYGIQFHPEVSHTLEGLKILKNFVVGICGCHQSWTPDSFIESTVGDLRSKLGDDQVVLGLSGGVDSSVAGILLHRAIGKNLHCIFVDNGLLRKDEFRKVMDSYRHMHLNVAGVDASERFLSELRGVDDPEQKRKIIGRVFIDVFEEEATKIKGIRWLAQGTIYPDVIESRSVKGPSATIKSHHNVGGLPEHLNLNIVEPLNSLFKDEVRRVGNALGLDPVILGRHPFPGPGLAVRILGSVTKENIRLLQDADEIFIEGLRIHRLYDRVWQAFVVLLPIQSVGVMGDERTYENVVALRAVTSTDGMTADWAHLPHEFLAWVSNEIINNVKGVNRVVYDISSKPPATIEWE
jgi:GMP synthase (glutamine-hydrolysing)